MKGDYSVAPDLLYSAFPWPDESDKHQQAIADAAHDMLNARPEDQTLEDLYDPLTMPKPLYDAHQVLDRTVDRAYSRHTHSGDDSRIAVLLDRYTELDSQETAGG